MNLKEFFSKNPRVAIAFSGGVDSAYLLYMAKKYAKEVSAYFAKSAFQPAFELEDAKKLAEQIGIDLKVVNIDIFAHPNVIANDEKRCYHCKKAIFTALKNAAQKDGFSTFLDGTNASDKYEDRPGMKALAELEVYSPLRLAGLKKEEVRRLSKELGLFTWDKPAYACLATRAKQGQKITIEDLKTIEKAEDELFKLGFVDFRLRLIKGGAKIEISSKDIGLLLAERKNIIKKLSPLFDNILLDIKFRDDNF